MLSGISQIKMIICIHTYAYFSPYGLTLPKVMLKLDSRRFLSLWFLCHHQPPYSPVFWHACRHVHFHSWEGQGRELANGGRAVSSSLWQGPLHVSHLGDVHLPSVPFKWKWNEDVGLIQMAWLGECNCLKGLHEVRCRRSLMVRRGCTLLALFGSHLEEGSSSWGALTWYSVALSVGWEKRWGWGRKLQLALPHSQGDAALPDGPGPICGGTILRCAVCGNF